MGDSREELPTGVRALLEVEAGAPVDARTAKARVRERLEATLLLGAGISAASPPANSFVDALRKLAPHAAIKPLVLVSTFVAGAGSGALIQSKMARPVPQEASSPPMVTTIPDVASPLTLDAEVPPVQIAIEPEPPRRAAPLPISTPTRPSSREGVLLLERARAALARDRPADALIAIEAQARLPDASRWAEERQALRVQALARSGRTQDANAAAEQFLRIYPRSLFAPAVRIVSGEGDGSDGPAPIRPSSDRQDDLERPR